MGLINWQDFVGTEDTCGGSAPPEWEEVYDENLFIGDDGASSSVYLLYIGDETYDVSVGNGESIYILAQDSLADKGDAYISAGLGDNFTLAEITVSAGGYLHELTPAGITSISQIYLIVGDGSLAQSLSIIGIKAPNSPMFRFTAIMITSVEEE